MMDKPSLIQTAIRKLPTTAKVVSQETTALPGHRLYDKVRRTIIGLVVIAGGIAGGQIWDWSQWLVAGMIVLGASVWSSSLVLLPLKVILPLVTDVIRAVRGGKPDA